MTWDLSSAPELREALIDLLADALVSLAERAEAGTGVTRGGLNRRAENANDGDVLGTSTGRSAGAVVSLTRPGIAPAAPENIAPAGVGAPERTLVGRRAEGVQKAAQ